ncbi:Cephalosporin-C deacetylase [Aquirufa nivalisilvae]|uniref:Cephalosporin-C deacetylase n=1 Tax=Aquirufa nivalisilvae TaxID=2516557 RepID=A0A2S2DX78_9BACT|nr:acetylxylan esterase [Aquirufa nivalisilvae]AWL09949.1 Cephalosporin-C deacetylase [Aquirufa nivalisilvae]
MKKIFFLLCLLFSVHLTLAQPTEKQIKVQVSADHADWLYKPGEKVNFSVVVSKNGSPIPQVKIRYEIGPEKQEPWKKDNQVLANGSTQLDGGTLTSAGFLRCIVIAEVEGKEYRNLATVGFSPNLLQATVANPSDFDAFWDKAKQELAKIPLDAKMTLMPERCTEKTNVYHVNIQNYRLGARLYGILCVPKKMGKYPALLHVPGAGVRPYAGDIANAEKGMITLQIGIHGIPVNMDPSVYTDLGAGILNGYPTYNMDDKDRFFYKRVYVGCVRANDFLTSLPQYDGQNLAVTGGSQGGALSIVTSALDNRVKFLGAYYPALADVTGYLFNRAGGWPHYFDKNSRAVNETKAKLETIAYYDVVNFARRLKVPGFYSWGFNDETCPPTSMYAAYNVISAPKELYLALDTGHWNYPEQVEKMTNWLTGNLIK